jgi:hypothetical protein
MSAIGPKDYLYLAQSPHATPEELTKLAQSPYPFVVEAVATHPTTPGAVLGSLVPAAAESWHEQRLLRLLAKNPSLPAQHLAAIAERLIGKLDNGRANHEAFAAGLALIRPDTPFDCLANILVDHRTAVQFRKAAARESPRADLMGLLARDLSETVRRVSQRRLSAEHGGRET